jgi:hypothetical protein
MRQRIVSSVVAANLLLPNSFALLLTSPAHAEECLGKPNAPAAQGQHWYYNTDRATKRKCWFLAEQGRKAATKAARVAPARKPSAAPPNVPAEPELRATTQDVVDTKTEVAPSQASAGEPAAAAGTSVWQEALAAPTIDQPNASVLLGSASPATTGASPEPLRAAIDEAADAARVWPAPAPEPAPALEPPPAPVALAASHEPPTSSIRLASMLAFLGGALASALFAGHAMLRHAGRSLNLARRAPSDGWR